MPIQTISGWEFDNVMSAEGACFAMDTHYGFPNGETIHYARYEENVNPEVGDGWIKWFYTYDPGIEAVLGPPSDFQIYTYI